MKSSSDHLPDRIYPISERLYHFVFGLEVIELEGRTIFNYEIIEICSCDYDEIVRKLIEEKYSIDQETALINNFNANIKVDEYIIYQQFREIAKLIAQSINITTKSQIEEFVQLTKKIKITLPISKILAGGVYYNLADMLLKKRAIYTSTDTHVIVWLSYILPDDLAILQVDPEVSIE